VFDERESRRAEDLRPAFDQLRRRRCREWRSTIRPSGRSPGAELVSAARWLDPGAPIARSRPGFTRRAAGRDELEVRYALGRRRSSARSFHPRGSVGRQRVRASLPARTAARERRMPRAGRHGAPVPHRGAFSKEACIRSPEPPPDVWPEPSRAKRGVYAGRCVGRRLHALRDPPTAVARAADPDARSAADARAAAAGRAGSHPPAGHLRRAAHGRAGVHPSDVAIGDRGAPMELAAAQTGYMIATRVDSCPSGSSPANAAHDRPSSSLTHPHSSHRSRAAWQVPLVHGSEEPPSGDRTPLVRPVLMGR
jgi:hypothetical protein